ncbi:hypothetical protein [Evansella halocellulosilytica]|uniref:hypothetical protein n=1 Tax=Evansella halocellulosilytica TaxID=2011013 RepID=UPI000BB84EBE|nr:hypothetical protein [Evansella halocellulosilytica]
MFGIFLDWDNKRIVYGEDIYIKSLEKLSEGTVRHTAYKGMSFNEMYEKLFELKRSLKDFELIPTEVPD